MFYSLAVVSMVRVGDLWTAAVS